MKKLRAFNMVELMIVAGLMLTTVILCIPVIFNNSKEAKIISNWKHIYTEMRSNFEVFSISDAEKVERICSIRNLDTQEKDIFKILSPYLNIDLEKNTNSLKHYHYKFQNGSQVSMQSPVFTRFFSYQENGNIGILMGIMQSIVKQLRFMYIVCPIMYEEWSDEERNIVGFKWLTCECSDEKPCASVLFDMNGTKKPNKIGKDIFGVYIYKNKIATFGSELSNRELARECNNSNGLSCSEYYLRGGKF